MAKACRAGKLILRESDDGSRRIGFWCPGCEMEHQVTIDRGSLRSGSPVWSFNGSYDQPTINPSIKVDWRMWEDGMPRDHVCHSFVGDGRIKFLDDCTHTMAGQMVELTDFPEDEL